MLKKEFEHSTSLESKLLGYCEVMKKLLARHVEAQEEIHKREEETSFILNSVRHLLKEYAIARSSDLVPKTFKDFDLCNAFS